MTLLDVLLLVIVTALGVRGYVRGWFREGVGACAATAIVVLMVWIAGSAFGSFTPIALTGLLLGGFGSGIAVSMLLSRLVAGGGRDHGLPSRIGGALFGGFGGAAVYTGIFLLLTVAVPTTIEGDRTARAYPLLTAGAERLSGSAPDATMIASVDYPAPLEDAHDGETAPARPIAWAMAELYGDKETRSLPGTVRAVDAATLAFEVPGLVSSVNVEAGERFSRGDVLAVLDERTYRLALEERRGQLADAQASLTEAEADYERNATLLGTGAVAEAVVDDKRAAFESARGQVRRLQASVDIAAENLADTRLIAPYDGAVAARQVEPAQRVSAGEAAIRVQSAEGLEVVVTVPDSVVQRLSVGGRHEVSPRGLNDRTLVGTVTRIDTDAEQANAYEVALRLAEAPEGLRTGSTAEVRFVLARNDDLGSGRSLVAIPATAFLPSDGQTTLAFVYDGAAGVVRERVVEVSDLTSDVVLVSRGLEGGEIVAAKGLPFLSDGQAVTLLGEGPDRYLVSQR